MKAGDKVRVYPYRGDPAKSAEGTILLASANSNSIAVAFGDRPDFLVGSFVNAEHGVMLLLSRTEDHWFAVSSGGELYEVGSDG